MLSSILKKLKEGSPIIMDGAMGTMLQSRGLPFGTPSSLWNHEKPEEVKKVHEAYIKAGAEMILTNTFSVANEESIKAGIVLAKKATQGQVYIGGSIGPKNQIHEKYLERFEEGEVDLIVLETMISKKEIAQFLKVYDQSKKIPLMVMMTVNERGLLPSGESFEKIVSFLNEEEIPIIGFNCSQGPQTLYPLFKKLQEKTDAYLAIKPNAGIPIERDHQMIYPLSTQEFAKWGKQFIDEGVHLFGGCCGTTPEMIQELVKRG